MSATGQRLATLLAPWLAVAEADDRVVADLTLDSRVVGPGSLFVAVGGSRGHGLDHVDDAVARGAAAVLSDRPCAHALPVPLIVLADLRASLGELAARYFEQPSAALDVFAVTGTNGKTTVTHLLAQAHHWLGRGCGYVGTLGAGTLDQLEPAVNTTPDVISLNRWLARFRAAGAGAAALEASSHALDQGRLAGLVLRAAGFTNLGHDHLDYHRDRAAYGRAKRRLFEHPRLAAAAINVDDELGLAIARDLRADVALWTLSSGGRNGAAAGRARVTADDLAADTAGVRFTLHAEGRSARVESSLGGRFNIDNLLCVAGLLLAAGHDFDAVAALLPRLVAAPGRMQRCGTTARGAHVLVDYAHSPDSLAAILAAARELAPRALWLVFGCGGERDRSKRPLMGAAAAEGADHVIVTSDNPRSEDPAAIAAEVVAGMPTSARARVLEAVIDDRAAAIDHALAHAEAGDLVLVAGKGHETSQERAGRKLPFSDVAEVARVIAGGGP